MATNPIDVQKALGGMDYPASKDQLVSHARDKGGDTEVVSALEAIPEQDYDSPAAVNKAIAGTD